MKEKAHRYRPLNLAGRIFGKLTVSHPASPAKDGRRRWHCQCSCGSTTAVTVSRLLSGMTRSCGCLIRETLRRTATTHGKSRTPEHRVWCGIVNRCHNPKEPTYPRYGGRGIKVCRRWRESFMAFLADLGPKPSPKHTLDRKNNDGNYEPRNCRWATRTEQARNKSNNRVLTHKGESLCLAEWAERTGIDCSIIKGRLRLGWSVVDALTRRPVKHVHL